MKIKKPNFKMHVSVTKVGVRYKALTKKDELLKVFVNKKECIEYVKKLNKIK